MRRKVGEQVEEGQKEGEEGEKEKEMGSVAEVNEG